MMRSDLARRADALAAGRVPFVMATVVRAQRPASVRPGDAALVLGDGTIEGFVGGACGESSVRLHALRALETGEALLLRIVPGDGEAPGQEGAVTVQNPCLSGGALEIFLEPRIPAPRIEVVGDTPIALSLADLGERLGYEVALRAGGDVELGDTAAVVVASHGRDEERGLTAALEAGVPYVGLVASRRRGAAVVDALRGAGLAEDRLARLHTPAGLDIGARSPEEIALAILAELVAERGQVLQSRTASDNSRPDPVAARTASDNSRPDPVAVDPVCGMEVVAREPSPHVDHGGVRVWFCGEGCRSAFLEDPARHALST